MGELSSTKRQNITDNVYNSFYSNRAKCETKEELDRKINEGLTDKIKEYIKDKDYQLHLNNEKNKVLDIFQNDKNYKELKNDSSNRETSSSPIYIPKYYESQESQTIICKPNEKLKTVSQKFCLNKGINFKKVYFLFDGKKIEKADYNKEVSELIQTNIRDELNILVYDINLSETAELNSDDFDKECEVIFWFKSRPNSIKCKLKSKMLDICQNIAKICGKDLYSIDFIFKDKK